MQNPVEIPVTLKVEAEHQQRPPARPIPHSGIAVASSAEELSQPRGVPITLHALLERGNNWIVTLTEHEMPR